MTMSTDPGSALDARCNGLLDDLSKRLEGLGFSSDFPTSLEVQEWLDEVLGNHVFSLDFSLRAKEQNPKYEEAVLNLWRSLQALLLGLHARRVPCEIALLMKMDPLVLAVRSSPSLLKRIHPDPFFLSKTISGEQILDEFKHLWERIRPGEQGRLRNRASWWRSNSPAEDDQPSIPPNGPERQKIVAGIRQKFRDARRARCMMKRFDEAEMTVLQIAAGEAPRTIHGAEVILPMYLDVCWRSPGVTDDALSLADLLGS
jgi:hypothetical protein